MKTIIYAFTICVLTLTGVAQSRWTFMNRSRGPNGATWYYKAVEYDRNGDADLWIKLVPTKPVLLPGDKRHRKAAYIVTHVMFDCSRPRRTIDKTFTYLVGTAIPVDTTFAGSSFREPIMPGTIDYENWASICQPE